jgi:hypothetical protein
MSKCPEFMETNEKIEIITKFKPFLWHSGKTDQEKNSQ